VRFLIGAIAILRGIGYLYRMECSLAGDCNRHSPNAQQYAGYANLLRKLWVRQIYGEQNQTDGFGGEIADLSRLWDTHSG
jgi:hypothetical protein